MELRVLQYFLAVAREQSISAAAESLHLSQPTLSTQLKALEQELGKQLLIRGTKGSRKVLLTEEGMLLRKRAEEILELVRMTESEISLSNEVIAGDVYIGTGESDMIRIFARAAKRIQEKHPDIHYHILSGNAAFVQEHLDRGLIDFGVVYSPVDTNVYSSIQVPIRDTWGVLMRKDAPLAQKALIQPQDLWDQPLILSAQKTDAWPMSNWFGQDITKLNVVATYNLVFNASLLVEEGLGYAVCFDKLINVSGNSNLCFRPLSPKMEAEASIIWKRYQVFPELRTAFCESCTMPYIETLAQGDHQGSKSRMKKAPQFIGYENTPARPALSESLRYQLCKRAVFICFFTDLPASVSHPGTERPISLCFSLLPDKPQPDLPRQ